MALVADALERFDGGAESTLGGSRPAREELDLALRRTGPGGDNLEAELLRELPVAAAISSRATSKLPRIASSRRRHA